MPCELRVQRLWMEDDIMGTAFPSFIYYMYGRSGFPPPVADWLSAFSLQMAMADVHSRCCTQLTQHLQSSSALATPTLLLIDSLPWPLLLLLERMQRSSSGQSQTTMAMYPLLQQVWHRRKARDHVLSTLSNKRQMPEWQIESSIQLSPEKLSVKALDKAGAQHPYRQGPPRLCQ